MRKSYEAIVAGFPAEVEGRIGVPIAESRTRPGVMKINNKRGKPSATNFKVIEMFDGYAFLEVVPESGR